MSGRFADLGVRAQLFASKCLAWTFPSAKYAMKRKHERSFCIGQGTQDTCPVATIATVFVTIAGIAASTRRGISLGVEITGFIIHPKTKSCLCS